MANGKVTIAEIKKDIGFLQSSQNELKQDIKEIKTFMEKDLQKNAALEGSIGTLKWVFGALMALLGLAIAAVGYIK